VDVISNPASNDEPEMLDVEKPFIHIECSPYKVHFFVPKVAVMEKYELAAG
jgi:hypothetical protein